MALKFIPYLLLPILLLGCDRNSRSAQMQKSIEVQKRAEYRHDLLKVAEMLLNGKYEKKQVAELDWGKIDFENIKNATILFNYSNEDLVLGCWVEGDFYSFDKWGRFDKRDAKAAQQISFDTEVTITQGKFSGYKDIKE